MVDPHPDGSSAPPHFDVAVIGAGPLGAATARHAAEAGASVLLVGPAEPEDHRDHEGVWAGHYDQGRLCHVLEVPLVTAMLATRSMRRFDDLIARTGINFLTPTHSVTVLPGAQVGGSASTWFDRDLLAGNAADLGVEVDQLDEAQLAAAYPDLSFEPGHVALRQRDAFILNPRALVEAELAAALAAGTVLVRDEVVERVVEGDRVRLRGAQGGEWTADRVVLAVGFATNASGLLPRPLVTLNFGATVTLVEVDGPDAVPGMPTMMMLKQRAGEVVFGGIVMAPVQYPDGKWYLKLSGQSLLANPLDSREEIAAWVRTGGRAQDVEESLAVLSDLLPRVSLGAARTRPCMVCATPSDRPYIDWADERTVVLVEGERGAMAADEIGRLASGLALRGAWTDTLPAEVFAAQWAPPGFTTRGALEGSRA